MAKHRSVEAKRLTELGRGLHAWSNVLLNGASVYDSSDKAAMREIALMEDTPENRGLLQDAAYRCGLPESEAESLVRWVDADVPLGNLLPKGYGFSLFGMRSEMLDELANYVKNSWPSLFELADMVEENDADVAACWLVNVKPWDVAEFRRGNDLVSVWFDTSAGAARSIAKSCPDLEHPPVCVAVCVNVGDIEHVVCDDIEQAARLVAERIAQCGKEGK